MSGIRLPTAGSHNIRMISELCYANNMHPQAKYFNAFNLFKEKIGPSRFKKLLGYFGNLKDAWQANAAEFAEAGLEKELVQEIITRRALINPDEEFEKLTKEGISVITILDKNYPRLLKEIYDPPYLLYIRGEFKKEDEFALAVVGTRQPSSYGEQITPWIVEKLASAGLTIVSGLARGIDTMAHLGALSVGGRTIGVAGAGIDKQSIYPPSNRQLAEKIAQQGAIISEYPIGALALRHHFPTRNRIISGLSRGVLVVEAAAKSGALLTANHALAQNREVFTIPGSIYSKASAGPNELIKMGAKLITRPEDIFDELNLQSLKSYIENRQVIPESPEEEKILKILSHEPIHIDKIIQMTKMDAASVNATLSIMEMKGKVRNLGGNNFVLSH